MTRLDEPTLARIERELGRDGVWVAPALRDVVGPADEARIEEAVAAQPTPTYVALVELSYDDELTSGRPEQLAYLVRDDTGREGTYLVPRPYSEPGTYQLEVQAFPQEYDLYAASEVAADELPGDLTGQVLRTLELLRTPESQTLYDELRSERDAEDGGLGSAVGSTGGGDTGDADGGVPVPVFVGVLALVVAVAALLARRRRHRAVPRARGTAFVLPDTVVRTVREAEDRRHEALAEESVLGLGEAIDAAHLDPRRSRGLGAWQAALDHYDVASRILHRQHSPADVVGALVLARRGREALTAAVAGRDWRPTPSCYFHPLHGEATARARWDHLDAWVEVPVCRDCEVAVARDVEPRDVLDFVEGDRPAHYFRLDLGAWSRTGYGSLDTDLLGALLRP